jgi:hypothetical protein
MKAFVTAVLLTFSVMAVQAADAPKKDDKVVENCVKKDKNGKCPPTPKSEKPTPKKKVEEKK